MSLRLKKQEKMKAILEFNLEEDSEEFRYCMDASKMRSLLVDLDEKLRSEIKYCGKEYMQEFRDLLHLYLDDHGINLL